jgi:hypothetical protein
MQTMKLLILLVLLSVPCFANELPIKPETRPHTADREFWIEVGAMGTAWTIDAVSTHQAIVAHPTRYEVGLLNYGSRSSPKIMGTWAAVDLGAMVISYEWKRHITNRYLHPLWRVPMVISAVGHTHAAIGNWRE